MYADMEQWVEIRRRVLTNEIGQREACRQYQIHWLTLKKILAHEEPPGYRRTRPPKIDPVLPVRLAVVGPKSRHAQVLKKQKGLFGWSATPPAPLH